MTTQRKTQPSLLDFLDFSSPTQIDRYYHGESASKPDLPIIKGDFWAFCSQRMMIFPPIHTLPPSKRLSWKNIYFPGDLINIKRLIEAKCKEFFKSSLTAVPFLNLLLPALCSHTIAKTPQWGCGRGKEVQGIFKPVLTILLLPHASLLYLHPYGFF